MHEQSKLFNKLHLQIVSQSFRDWENAVFNVLSKLEPLNLSLKKLTFLPTLSASIRSYARKEWKTRICSTCKLRIYQFVKKQRFRVLMAADDSCEENCN